LEQEISENELYAPEDLKNWLKKRKTEKEKLRKLTKKMGSR
jgi:hypothetical protein